MKAKESKMTGLEKKIIATINNGGDIWDIVAVAQQYHNDNLIDRVLDNILKFGLDKIKEKPNRIFYGDNHKVLPLEEELVGAAEQPERFEGFGVGRDYDESVEIICGAGMASFTDYIKKCENRKPQIAAQYNLELPVIQWQKIYHKTHPIRTDNLRKICGSLGIILPVCEHIIDLPEGLCCMNHDTTQITIIIIK